MTKPASEHRVGAVGVLVSVNVGRPRDVDRNGRPAQTAIWKIPVPGRVRARGVNLDGDDQADRRAHGGPDKAIYAYAIEDHRWWETDLEGRIDIAGFGENLTTEGIELTTAVVGERWHIGSTVLEVSEPRLPCWRLNMRMNDPHFVRRFAAADRPGAYLRIIQEGDVGVGDRVEIVSQPDHGLTVGEVARVFHGDRSAASQLLDIDDLSDSWRSWAQRTLERHATPNEPCPGCD